MKKLVDKINEIVDWINEQEKPLIDDWGREVKPKCKTTSKHIGDYAEEMFKLREDLQDITLHYYQKHGKIWTCSYHKDGSISGGNTQNDYAKPLPKPTNYIHKGNRLEEVGEGFKKCEIEPLPLLYESPSPQSDIWEKVQEIITYLKSL